MTTRAHRPANLDRTRTRVAGGNRRCRWGVLGVAAAASVVGLGGLWGVPPPSTAVAGECFQKGGYMPPPCSATPGQGDAIQQAVPDSGLNACQNQSAMVTAIGLIPAVCPPTVPGQPS
jgi:hypothetical protein